MTRLGNRFFTEWYKSTLVMHYFKFILRAGEYLFEKSNATFTSLYKTQTNVDKFVVLAMLRNHLTCSTSK